MKLEGRIRESDIKDDDTLSADSIFALQLELPEDEQEIAQMDQDKKEKHIRKH